MKHSCCVRGEGCRRTPVQGMAEILAQLLAFIPGMCHYHSLLASRAPALFCP